jgi:hypothetical protein
MDNFISQLKNNVTNPTTNIQKKISILNDDALKDVKITSINKKS